MVFGYNYGQCCRNCISDYNPPASSSNILSESYS
jgi:hypothetical protein